jgi:hypothetical protein
LQEDFENPYKKLQAVPQDPAQIDFGPETLYYPSIFVWIPTALLPKDFAIKCVFCGNCTMGESGVPNLLFTFHESDPLCSQAGTAIQLHAASSVSTHAIIF